MLKKDKHENSIWKAEKFDSSVSWYPNTNSWCCCKNPTLLNTTIGMHMQHMYYLMHRSISCETRCRRKLCMAQNKIKHIETYFWVGSKIHEFSCGSIESWEFCVSTQTWMIMIMKLKSVSWKKCYHDIRWCRKTDLKRRAFHWYDRTHRVFVKCRFANAYKKPCRNKLLIS